MCVLKLRTFFSRPLQNRVVSKREPEAHYLSFHLVLHAALIRYAEINLWRRKRR